MQEPSKNRRGITSLKFFSTIVNVIVLFCESVLVGAIVYLSLTEKATLVQSFGQKAYEFSFGAIISVGIVVIFFTILGSLGAINENSSLLKIYCSLMLVFLIGEVGALAYTATQINVTSKYAEMALYESLKHYNSSQVVTRAWDTFQHTSECCGMRQPEGPELLPYKAFFRANLTETVPKSCCVSKLDDANLRKCVQGSETFIHKADCYLVLQKQLSRSYHIIVGIGGVKIIITVSALVLSVMLLMII